VFVSVCGCSWVFVGVYEVQYDDNRKWQNAFTEHFSEQFFFR